MRNFNKIDDFFAFITDAGEAVLTLCADPWFHSAGGDTGAFIAFMCRQKENMIRIAAASEALSDEDYRENSTPAELSDTVAAVLSERSIRDFFGLSMSSGMTEMKAGYSMQSSPAV